MKIFCIIILQISTYSNQLNAIISQYLSNPSAENVNVSMSVRKLSTDVEVYSYQSKMALTPASTLKLLTTATALDLLGADFKFKTYISKTGNVENGELKGDLVISTHGDFSFGSKRLGVNAFNEILEVLKNNNIRKINGTIKIEENKRIETPTNWLLGDLGNYYGAHPKQFNFNENYYTVYFNGGEHVGDSAKVTHIYPNSQNWKITNHVKTAEKGSGDQVNIINLAPSNDITFSGTVPLKSVNFEVKGSIPEVKSVYLDLFRAECLKNGILVLDAKDFQKETLDTIATLFSPALSTITEHCNFRSVNFFADGLSNFLKLEATDSIWTYDAFLKSYWLQKGLNLANFKFIDGSGLSPLNTISTQTMTSFLSNMNYSSHFGTFLNTIPKVGKNGTVQSLDPKGKTKGRIYAKSGSISGTRNYAGYFLNEKKELFAFGIFVNGFNNTADLLSRQLLQNLMFKMIDFDQ